MDISKIRLANMRHLESVAGSRQSLAEKMEIAYAQLSHYIGKNPVRNIGDKVARRAEEVFGLQNGWMDRLHGQADYQAAAVSNGGEPALAKPNRLRHRLVPIKGTGKMGNDGYFNFDDCYASEDGDGYIPSYSASPSAYALRGSGGSMHPVIRDGWYVVCEPETNPVPTEFVLVCLLDGRCIIKEFIAVQNGLLHLLSVNGGERLTFELSEVSDITPIIEIAPPSRRIMEMPIYDV